MLSSACAEQIQLIQKFFNAAFDLPALAAKLFELAVQLTEFLFERAVFLLEFSRKRLRLLELGFCGTELILRGLQVLLKFVVIVPQGADHLDGTRDAFFKIS